MKALKKVESSLLVALVTLVALMPSAQAVDFSTVTGAFDTAGITTGILAIGALMMAVVAVGWGVRKLLGFGR